MTPDRNTAAIRSEVAIGRLMNRCDGLIVPAPLAVGRSRASSSASMASILFDEGRTCRGA